MLLYKKFFWAFLVIVFFQVILVTIFFILDLQDSYPLISFLFFLFNTLLFFVFFLTYSRKNKLFNNLVEDIQTISSDLANSYGETGIAIFDNNYTIIWTNDFLKNRLGQKMIGLKVHEWIKNFGLLLEDPTKKLEKVIGGRNYQIRLFPETRFFLLKDVTNYNSLLKLYNEETLFLGILKIDNYEKVYNSFNEKNRVLFFSIISQKLIEWYEEHSLFSLNYASGTYLFMGNQRNLDKLFDSQFDVTEIIKKETKKKIGTGVSLSIGMSHGDNDVNNLYKIASENLNKAIAKGGDQVISRKYGETNYQIYGARTENFEESLASDLKFFSETFKQKLSKASNIIISGHKWGDYDSLASCRGVYEYCLSVNKPAKIIINFDLLDSTTIKNLKKILSEEIVKEIYIKPKDAYKFLQKNTLLIVCDTHSINRIEEPEIIDKVENIIVLDHHRLTDDKTIQTPIIYLNPAASSTSEIVTELLYQLSVDNILRPDACTLLLTGILLDTNNFRVRTSQRTYEIAAILKSWGADPISANNLLKEDYHTELLKNKVLSNMQEIKKGFVVAVSDRKQFLARSILAQIAQEIIQIEGIEFAACVSLDEKNNILISFRSNGTYNVQALAEKLGGGGHFSASATLIPNNKVGLLKLDEVTDLIKNNL